MEILMVSSEAVPYSKSGGLADVTSSLSTALAQLDHDVRLVLPNYKLTDHSTFTEMDLEIEVKLANKVEVVKVLEKSVNKVKIYLIDHKWFNSREGLYGQTSFTPYPDNLLRYTLISKAALELCKALKWAPRIVHAHDWTTGFLPALVKNDNSKFFNKTKTVFTIHNLAYQGEFVRLDTLLADLPFSEGDFIGFGVNKRVNMLKAALEQADLITTVSPTYAKEIQTAKFGNNLDYLLKSRSEHLVGILNGIDIDEWNPETDQLLKHHYSKNDLSNKALLKKELQSKFALEVNEDIALIGMISRIAEQKGFVELCQGTPCLLEQILSDMDVQIVIVGTGDSALEEKLANLAQLHKNLSVNFIFDNEAAHLVEAGSDFFLMPSRYEPCGLNQMYSLRYATLPIAHRTGGLADSIIDVDNSNGTGFLFDEMSSATIYGTIERALKLYYEDKKLLEEVRIRAMEQDFSWEHSAQEYIKSFEKILEG
jgi:starch synthase